jgi:hypothetical protein
MPETNLSSVLLMAVSRRDEARREAAGWDDFIRRLELLGIQRNGKEGPISGFTLTPATERSRKPEPAVAETIEASSSFMASVGRPVGISELYAEMSQRGVPIGGKDPKRTLDARLRYSKAFRNLPGRGWWFIDRPIPGDGSDSAAGTHEMPAAPMIPPKMPP